MSNSLVDATVPSREVVTEKCRIPKLVADRLVHAV